MEREPMAHEVDWNDIGSVCRQFGNERAILDDLFASRLGIPKHNWWKEAADEIARLRAALRGAQEALGEGEWIAASDILFDALAGKEG